MNETKDSKFLALSALIVSFFVHYDKSTNLIEGKMKVKSEEMRAHFDSLYMESYERMTFYRKQIEEYIQENI